MAGAYLLGILIVCIIICFCGVVQLVAALRVHQQRARELYFGGLLFMLGLLNLIGYDLYAHHDKPWLLRWAGPAMYFMSLLAAFSFDSLCDEEVISQIRSSGGQVKPWPARSQRRLVLGTLLCLAVVGSAIDIFTDWPVAYRSHGPVDYGLLGRLEYGRVSVAAVAAHGGFGGVAIGWCMALVVAGRRRGHEGLRGAVAVLSLSAVVFSYDLLCYCQQVTWTPLGNYGAGATALFLVWHRIDSQARLIAVERRRVELGGYRLLERIGAGGMAEVFVAQRIGPAGFQKEVAIKRILPHLAQDRRFVEMFLDEARLAARLTHRNIVEIRELGEEGGVFFMVMELVRGKNLHELLALLAARGIRPPIGVAVHLVREVLAALQSAHTLSDESGGPLGVVHRDVSPHNVLVSTAGDVKLADFGIARAADRVTQTRTGAIKGKLPYMSPEQARSEAVDGRSDLFSAGVLLYQLVTGRRPFRAGSEAALIGRINTGTFDDPRKLLPSLPPAVAAVISRALSVAPGARFPTAAAMSEALLDAMGKQLDAVAAARWLATEVQDAASAAAGAPRPAPDEDGSPAPEESLSGTTEVTGGGTVTDARS